MPSVEDLNELLRGVAVLHDAQRAERSEEARPPLQPYVIPPATLFGPACNPK